MDKPDINFYHDKGTVDIPGYTKVNWMSGYSVNDLANFNERIDLFSSGLNANGVQNRHLYPIPNSVISDSQGKLKNSYGF